VNRGGRKLREWIADPARARKIERDRARRARIREEIDGQRYTVPVYPQLARQKWV
jgi:hypothetical protein